MPYLCLNCGSLEVTKVKETYICLSDDGEEKHGASVVTIKCNWCHCCGVNLIEFQIIHPNREEVARRLLAKNRRRSVLIEFAKLLLANKIKIKDDKRSAIDMIIDELKILGEEGKKVALLLKVAYRD